MNNNIIKLLCLFIIISIFSGCSFKRNNKISDDVSDESRFYNPKYHNLTITLKSDDSKDDSERLQCIIDKLHNEGGGKIEIDKGDFYFSNIILKSGVHIYINQNAKLNLKDNNNNSYKSNKSQNKDIMFYIGNSEETVSDVSIESMGENVSVDLTSNSSYGKRFICVKKADGFTYQVNEGKIVTSDDYKK